MSRTLEERFFSYVSVQDDGCWLWRGSLSPNGYGRLAVSRYPEYAHRVSYRLHVGEIPDGLQLDHLCSNRACVNPAHLEAVTQAENLRRGKALVTRCPRGHEYDQENTYVRPGGGRKCRACARAAR